MMRLLPIILSICLATQLQAQTKYQKDFDFYWTTVKENFGYFDVQKTDWDKVKTIYQPVVDTIGSRNSFISFLERVNNELYNGHVSLNTNLPSSSRLVPTGADLWVERVNGKFVIMAVRKGFNAADCGLKVGMKISRYNDAWIDSAVELLLPRSVDQYDDRMYEYAANLLLAGRHNEQRKIAVMINGVEKTYYPDKMPNKTEQRHAGIIEQKIVGDNVGYIRINNSLGNMDLIGVFDSVLNNLWNTKGLIIDLRETPSGGNSIVARAIMSRFIDKQMPYQRHCMPDEERVYGVKRTWVELVTPRSKIYRKPLVVLVNRWTGSMGEGIAIGFDGMKRAKIVGDKMAGLLGAIYSFTMPETGIGFSVPVEKLYHVNGTAREKFVPEYRVVDNELALAKAVSLLKGE